MAVIEVSEPIQFKKKYIGLNGDAKPTDAPAGSEYFAYDTGRWFINRDGTNWDIFAI
jgi:hypothetical protein